MSIESKQLLIHDMERKLKSMLTIDKAEEVMEVLSEELGYYEIERTYCEEQDVESKELLDAYISAKRVEGRSENTLSRYKYVIEKATESIGVPIKKISVFHIRRYLASEKKRGISDRTLEGIREVLSAYFGWLHKEGLISSNPIVNLGTIKYQKVNRLPYSQVDIENLKENCDCVRDKAIICFLLSTGCRIGEVCALSRDDIDFESKECVVLGKGNKRRIAYLDDIAAMTLKRYLDNRSDNNEALFIGKRGNRFTPGGVRNMLHRIADKADVENAHPHRFRRTLITNLIDRGMPIQEVSILVGHDKIDTTMTYIYKNNRNIKNSFQKYI